jgi:hypothetical protein
MYSNHRKASNLIHIIERNDYIKELLFFHFKENKSAGLSWSHGHKSSQKEFYFHNKINV